MFMMVESNIALADLEFCVKLNCEKFEVELSCDEVMGLSSSQYFIAILMRAAFEC